MMRWADSSTGYPILNETTLTYPTQVNSYIDMPVYPPTSRPYTCTTYFDSPIAYSHTWTLPTIYVQHLVNDIRVIARVNYFKETSVVCTAQGYPTPEFRWTDVTAGISYDGIDTLPINANGEGRYRCEATNAVRGESLTLSASLSTDITEGVPDYCPTTSTLSTASSTTTAASSLPTTTELAAECGRLMTQVPTDESTPPSGWSTLCYISQDDVELVSTQCRYLIENLPGGIGDYNDLLGSGGNFGCAVSSRADYIQAPNACFDNYQQTTTLAACPGCYRLFICIRYD
jgi:hypothetical protein